jgi:hypothetical protein
MCFSHAQIYSPIIIKEKRDFMICNQCGLELQQTAVLCPKCGTPAPRTVAGFEHTLEVKEALGAMVDAHGCDILCDTKKLIAFLNDYLPEYEKERRLIRNIVNNDVIMNMMKEDNHTIAIVKAKEFMQNELFLSENACEFILECFTYVLRWEYAYCAEPVKTVQPAAEPAEEQQGKKKQAKKDAPTEYKPKVFKGSNAFKYKFIGNVKIADGFTEIEGFCFDGFGSIKTVQLPESLHTIGEYAFSECKRLREIDLPYSLRTIKKSAFSSCGSLTSVKIPYGVMAIEEGTFSFCHNLEAVDIPESVSSIGDEAFSGCERLYKLFIPESVKFIGENVFSLCPNLIVRCYANSYVHKYCINEGINIELLQRDGYAF